MLTAGSGGFQANILGVSPTRVLSPINKLLANQWARSIPFT
jgi:hypothetical protein